MIKKFSCKNFRNIYAKDLQFEKINILIGANNSGKTNFIKALSFYSDMLSCSGKGGLKTAFLNTVARNGWDHAHNNETSLEDPIEFSWEISINDVPVRYTFSYMTGSSIENCNITLEELNAVVPSREERYQQEFNYFRCHSPRVGNGHFSTAVKKGQKNQRVSFELDSKEILSMQFKDILLMNKKIYGNELIRVNIAQLLYELEDFFKAFRVYTSVQFHTKKMREPVDNKSLDNILNVDAANFVNVFTKYKSEDIRWKKQFENKMKELIPSLEMADSVSAYDKLVFKLLYDEKEYDLSDVSEGTLKGLILNMLINMPQGEKISLLAVDEPETNLHPAWQKVIGNWLQTSETFRQCFVSTHSPDFLDVFTEDFKQGRVAVFVFDNHSSEPIKRVSYNEIADELGDWELGDLYRTNDPALGGWPW